MGTTPAGARPRLQGSLGTGSVLTPVVSCVENQIFKPYLHSLALILLETLLIHRGIIMRGAQDRSNGREKIGWHGRVKVKDMFPRVRVILNRSVLEDISPESQIVPAINIKRMILAALRLLWLWIPKKTPLLPLWRTAAARECTMGTFFGGDKGVIHGGRFYCAIRTK